MLAGVYWGANDAVEYYKLVNGNYSKLAMSFEWGWLQDHYNKKYS